MTRTEIHKMLCEGLNVLYSEKNADYGDSFRMVRKRIPHAILVRLHDKLNRLTNLMINGGQCVADESIDDTLTDLANYAIMELVERRFDELKGTTDSGL